MIRRSTALACCLAAGTLAAQDDPGRDTSRDTARDTQRVRALRLQPLDGWPLAWSRGDAAPELAFSGDGRFLALACDGELRIHRLAAADRPPQQPAWRGVLAGPAPGPRLSWCTPDGLWIYDAERATVVEQHRLTLRTALREPVLGPVRVQTARLAPGGDALLVSIGGLPDFVPNCGVFRCELDDGQRAAIAGGMIARALAWHPDGAVGACLERPRACGNAVRRGALGVADAAGSRRLGDARLPHAVAFAIDGRELFVCEERRVRRLRLHDGATLATRSTSARWLGVVDPVVGLLHDGRDLHAVELASLQTAPPRGARPLRRWQRIDRAALSPRRDRLAIAADGALHVFALRP